MKLVFLGTSGMVPTKERNVQSIYMEFQGEGILLDCGEGTQRQLQFANINAQKITTILISHWHGDHVSGLVGLLQTLGNFSHDEKKVRIYGPEGSKYYFDHLMQGCIFENKLDIELHEIDPKDELITIFEKKSYSLQAINLDHSVPCIGYKFTRNTKWKVRTDKLKEAGIPQGPHLAPLQQGKNAIYHGTSLDALDYAEEIPAASIAFIFDTQLVDACYELAEGSYLLVSEAVYLSSLAHKAEEYKHMTARQAAQVASQCGVEKLVLTHFSQRYKDVSELADDAKVLFDDVTCAYDFLKMDFPL